MNLLRRSDLEDREQVAALIGAGLLVAGLVVALVLLGASLWFVAIGVHPRHMLWGWLSTTSKDPQGHTAWGVGKVPILYVWSVVNAYLFYQLCELVYGMFRLFQRALIGSEEA